MVTPEIVVYIYILTLCIIKIKPMREIYTYDIFHRNVHGRY